MKLNCKINNPVVVCICGRSIATSRGKLIPHQPVAGMLAKDSNCPGSLMTLAELREHKRVVVI